MKQQGPQPPRFSNTGLDELFARFAARYGRTWTNQYGTSDAAMAIAYAEWGETLGGLTRAQVQHGIKIDADRASEFPPSSPAFKAMCLGIPSFAAMRYEMTHGNEARTPFGLLCWRFVDTFRLRQADQREADKLARDAYELAKAHVMAGGELPEVHELLAEPEPADRKPASPETAKRHLDAMWAVLKGGEQCQP